MYFDPYAFIISQMIVAQSVFYPKLCKSHGHIQIYTHFHNIFECQLVIELQHLYMRIS